MQREGTPYSGDISIPAGISRPFAGGMESGRTRISRDADAMSSLPTMLPYSMNTIQCLLVIIPSYTLIVYSFYYVVCIVNHIQIHAYCFIYFLEWFMNIYRYSYTPHRHSLNIVYDNKNYPSLFLGEMP